MKRLYALFFIIALLTLPTLTLAAAESASRMLVVYFSVPEDRDIAGVDAIAGASIVVRDEEKLGNLQFAAQIIARETGAELFRLETEQQYPLDHELLVDQAAQEQDDNARPALVALPDLSRYDTILLGYPDWWGDLPMPLYTFLESVDMSGKNVIPFTIHGGSGLADTLSTISGLQPGATVWDNALSISREAVAGSEADIVTWVDSLKLTPAAGAQAAPQTVARAAVDPSTNQTFFLWEKGNMPATTSPEAAAQSADGPGFRPNIETFPVPEGTPVKGAVLINAGGAFQFRGNEREGWPVAEALRTLGYQSFVVNYRLRPSTQEEGALDLARAVRFVRANAQAYGIDEKDIAVMGFSAGGILAGEMLLNFNGLVNGMALDSSYVPDALDQVSADAAACGMIYSFYGRLSVASTDVEKFAASELPPTYFRYGAQDPFVDEFEECVAALSQAGVRVESHVMEGWPHGFGATGDWVEDYDRFLTEAFAGN